MSPTHYEIFEGIPAPMVAEIVSRLKSQAFRGGDVLVREGRSNRRVVLVESGSLAVWRGKPNSEYGIQIARLKPGSCFGEMAAVRPGPASASIVAVEDGRVREFSLAELPAGDSVRQKVSLNLARLVARRLATTQAAVREKHEEQAEIKRRVAATSTFVTRNLVALACCMFSLPAIAARHSSAAEREWFALGFGALFFAIAWVFVRRNHFESDVLGMTWRGWPRQLGRSLAWTTPLLAALVGFKWVLVTMGWFGERVFEPLRAPALYGVTGFGGCAALAALFALASVALEFTRCTVQGSLAFLFDSRRRLATWGANIAANTVCAAVQVYVGAVSTLLIFILGLFWGWLFARERSFLAVAVSHALVGLWSVFILGLPE